MIKKILIILFFFNLFFSTAHSLGTNKERIQVGDYLVAKISNNENDYRVTKRFYQKIHRNNPTDLLALDRLLLLSLLDGDLLSANKYSFKLAQVGCDKSKNACCMSNQSPQGHLVNGISYLNSYNFNLADQSFASIWHGDLANTSLVRLLRAWVWAKPETLDKSIGFIDLISSNEDQLTTLIHKALIYDYVDELELAEVYYDQILYQSADLYIINLYINFLTRNNLEEKKQKVIREFLTEYDSRFISSLENQNNRRLIENQLQGIGVVFFNSPSMIRGLKPELIHLMFQLAAITSPNLHEINFMLASLLTSFEDYDKSIEVYNEIPKQHYLGEYASIQISNLYSLQDNNKEAIEQLEKFLKTKKTFDGFLSLGNYYRYDLEWEAAVEAYQKAIDIGDIFDNQNLWEAFFKVGIVHERSDNWDKAENYFLKALELYSDQPDVLNYLGYSYIDMDTNMGAAKEMIEKALQQKPNDPYIIDSMAWYYFKTGAYEEAKSLLEYAIDLMPYDPIINEHYGDALWKSGKSVEARFHWSKALELDPEEETIADIKIKILKGI
tara:strand:+ start:5538 stop:7202 length:1665 start_codon:yes stop_codon:yes gene_type:complete